MKLPEEMDEAFNEELHLFEEELNMPYITSLERLGHRRGRDEGLRDGVLEGIALLLDAKFGQAGESLMDEARAISSIEDIRRFAKLLKSAASLDAVRSHLAKIQSSDHR